MQLSGMEIQSPLRKFRTDNNLSLEELAPKFKVNKTTLSRWETGQVPAERCHDVEEVTGIPCHDLRPDVFRSARMSAA